MSPIEEALGYVRKMDIGKEAAQICCKNHHVFAMPLKSRR